MTHNAENDAPICFEGWAIFPHAVLDIRAMRTTDDRADVTCGACLWALGNQKYDPPAARVIPPGSDQAAPREEPWEWHPDGPEAHAMLERVQDEERA